MNPGPSQLPENGDSRDINCEKGGGGGGVLPASKH